VAASPYVGEAAYLSVFALRNQDCEDPAHPPRSLAILLPLVNNRVCPRDILSIIVQEREFERFGDSAGDRHRSPHLHHDHLRRAYKAVWEIATRRLTGR
jgi:hypothetical protein